MLKWVLSIGFTAVMGFLTYISAGVMDAKTLESRVFNLELRTDRIDKDMSDFKSSIKGDIGHIKGQNDIIIKMLQNRSGYERDK